MKRVVLFAATIAALAIALPASATPVTLTFNSNGVSWCNNCGTNGYLYVTSGTQVTAINFAISTLVVAGTGTSADGTYAVTDGGTGNGGLNFRTDPGAQYVNIVGAIPSLGIGLSTLLVGTGGPNAFGAGPFVTVPSCGSIPGGDPAQTYCFEVTFTGPDTKSPALLTALGISGNQWTEASFDIAQGGSNGFPFFSSSVVNTQQGVTEQAAVPEPATLTLLGLGLLGLSARLRAGRK